MQPAKLVTMANQIAGFFRSYPEDEAVAGIHRHLEAFWTPLMLRTLRQHLAHGAEGVDAWVTIALAHDTAASSPADKVLSPVREGGPIASDAG